MEARRILSAARIAWQRTRTATRLLSFLGLAMVASQLVPLEAGAPPAGVAPAKIAAPTNMAQAQARLATAPASAPAVHRLAVDRPLRHGDYAWNDEGVPPGRIRILVDLGAQTLSVFRGGHEIGRAIILYGTDEQPTPTGTFPITEKDADHVSNLYEAIMPWMLRLTDDGIAIHGSQVRYGWASRGCIGVPDEFAALMFAQARIGDQVTIVGGDPGAAPPTEPTGLI